jgi:hypothetical protein
VKLWIVGAVVGLLSIIAVGLLWVGGEVHYRNCLAQADLLYPVAFQQATDETNTQFEIGPQPEFVFHDSVRRAEALNDCSRWPL